MKILSTQIIGTNTNLKVLRIRSSRIAIFYMSRRWLKCAAKHFQYSIPFYVNASIIMNHRIIWDTRIRDFSAINLNVTLRNDGSAFQ